MKTVLRIFGILVILLALLAGAATIWRAERDKNDLKESQTEIAQAQQQLVLLKEEVKNMTGESKVQMEEQIATAEAGMKNLPSESAYMAVQALLAFLIFSSLVIGVFLFRPNLKLSSILMALSFVLLLACYFVSPNLKGGEYSGLAIRTLVLISGIPVCIAALFAFLIAKKKSTENLRSGR